MTIIKRVAPGSAFKVGLIVYGLMGLIAGVMCSFASLFIANCPLHAHLPFPKPLLSVVPIILCPLVWGVIGAIGATVSAVFYNLAASWVGGLEVETQ